MASDPSTTHDPTLRTAVEPPAAPQGKPAGVIHALERLADRGFHGTFSVDRGGLWCVGCRSHFSTSDLRWVAVEVVSGHAGVVIVGGLECPLCGAAGTACVPMVPGRTLTGRKGAGVETADATSARAGR